MKAMVLTAPGDLKSQEVSTPSYGAGNVLIRVSHSGVCGTDFKIYSGAIPVKYPRIMGHEMIGEIIAGGEDSGFVEGERVIIDPQLYCGRCFQCRIGQTHLCESGSLLGRETDGGFAEYVTAPTSHVFRLPDSLPSRVGPLIQVLATCLHAQRLVNIFPGESVAVLGLGVTGQLHIQLAKARGASPIIGITRSVRKRELAQKLGADLTSARDQSTVGSVLEATDGRGADVVIDTTGALGSLADAVTIARCGGRVLAFGIITATEGSLPFYQLYFKELSVINARAAKSEDYPASIDLVDRAIVRLEPLVSDVTPLGELAMVLKTFGSEKGERVKIILDHAGG
jgi:2-desacetyl-2-hydroxyethyl bacteriochlorophyllide A dehydrogenase